jgi:hypothetical protein
MAWAPAAAAAAAAVGTENPDWARVLLVRQCLRLPAVGFAQLNRVWSASEIPLPQVNHKITQDWEHGLNAAKVPGFVTSTCPAGKACKYATDQV